MKNAHFLAGYRVHDGSLLVGLFLVSFLVRFGVYAASMNFSFPDEADYVQLGTRIATTGLYGPNEGLAWPGIFRAPGLPYLLGGLYRLGLETNTLRVLLGILASALAPSIFFFLRSLGLSTFLALVPSLALAFHPVHVRASFELTTDAVTTTIGAFGLALYAAAIPNGRVGWLVGLGATMGTLVTLRTNLLFFAGPVVATAVRAVYRTGRLRPAALLAFAAFAPIAIFAAVRSAEEGRFLPLSDAGSEVFWRGNSMFTSGYLDGTRDSSTYLSDYRHTVGDAYGTPEASRRAYATAFSFIRSEPVAWAVLKARMLWRTWHVWPSFGMDPVVSRLAPLPRFAVQASKVAWAAIIAAALGLAIAGLAWGQESRISPVLAALVVAATLFGVFFYCDARYRMPYDAALFALAAIAVSRRSQVEESRT